MGKNVKDVMTSNPTTVQADASVVEAARIMRDKDTGIVPVVESDQLSGTVTDRDIAVRVVAEGRDPASTVVREIASTDVATVEPEQDLSDALRLMAERQVRRLPVVENGRLVGIVAQADVARESNDSQTGELVEEISKP
jgi:CBS domain-containing protein